MSNPKRVEIAGLDISIWVDLFNGCHINSGNGIIRVGWPDGGNYLDQYNITVVMFDIILKEIHRINNG